MKIFYNKKQFLVFYMLGFLTGILYANLAANEYMGNVGIFSEYFLKQYTTAEIVVEEYLLYLMKIRLIPFAVLFALSYTKFRKISVMGCLLWTGFSCGILACVSILNMGIKGILLCITGMMPQFLLYIPAYIILLWYSFTYPIVKWNIQKSIFTGLSLLVGIILEAYVNPILMELFIHSLQ